MATTQEDIVAAALTELGNAVSHDTATRASTELTSCAASASSSGPAADDAVASSSEDQQEHNVDNAQGPAALPIEPRVIQFIKISKTRQNHSYSDFSFVPPPEGYEAATEISTMSFAEKLHDILSRPEHSKTIRWMPHGRAFHVDIPKNMEKYGILMKYFNHGRYSSFLRQLNNHGFKHLTVGPDRNCYYHECFLQGLPHLTRYMPPAKDSRRLIADPDTEPNFYTIAKAYPLPCQAAAAATDMKEGPTIVPEPLGYGRQLKSDGMPPPPAPPVQPMSSIAPLVALLSSAMNQSAPVTNAPQVGSLFQQVNPRLPLPNIPQGNISSSNSLLAAFAQGTCGFPNNIPQLTGNPPVLQQQQQQGGNTTLNLLEALLVRQSQVTKKHEAEHPAANDRPGKVQRFSPAPVVPQAANMATADQRIQDVAQGLATVEKFRSEAQRLEAERKQAEEREQVASANTMAAQAALLAAILGNSGSNLGGR